VLFLSAFGVGAGAGGGAAPRIFFFSQTVIFGVVVESRGSRECRMLRGFVRLRVPIMLPISLTYD